MNKKTYISPLVSITKLGTRERLLSGSITGVQGVDDLTAGGSTSEAGITSGNVKGGGYSVWDDDWSK